VETTRKKSNVALNLDPHDFDAAIFDLDGVLTMTAEIHAEAWKRLFDGYLEDLAGKEGADFRPFSPRRDYREYVDGKPRHDGIRSFLDSRGIHLPFGKPDDGPDKATVCGLGNRKNLIFNGLLERKGARVHAAGVELVREFRRRGIRTAVVSSSRNCRNVLRAAGIEDLFDVRVDGAVSESLGLAGKPAPDIFLAACEQLGIEPSRAVVFEDAMAGVEGAKAGGFALIVGVDRTGGGAGLDRGGAHVVVADLSEIRVSASPGRDTSDALPSALDRTEEIIARMRGRRPAVFLDYDGTLTPIVERPELAVLSESMRRTVRALARTCPVAIISGRDLPDVRRLVEIDGISYAGSHGFDITGPGGERFQHEEGTRSLPVLDQAEREIRNRLGDKKGVQVERKRFAIAVHFRRASEETASSLPGIVDDVAKRHPGLRTKGGKKIIELQPGIPWDKGKAVGWLLEVLGLNRRDAVPLYIGDDLTDEDAFAEVDRLNGTGILVKDENRPTGARYALENPGEVKRFLSALTAALETH